MPPSYDQASSSPDQMGRLPPSQGYTGVSAHPVSPTPDHDPYYARYSQNSLASENGAYPVGGRRDDGDQYAENIPLQHASPQPDWMHQPTHYPPSPGVQQIPPSAGRGRRNRRFFKKKIPWVTYTLTTAQVVVFIVELVRNGKARPRCDPLASVARLIFRRPANGIPD